MFGRAGFVQWVPRYPAVAEPIGLPDMWRNMLSVLCRVRHCLGSICPSIGVIRLFISNRRIA